MAALTILGIVNNYGGPFSVRQKIARRVIVIDQAHEARFCVQKYEPGNLAKLRSDFWMCGRAAYAKVKKDFTTLYSKSERCIQSII